VSLPIETVLTLLRAHPYLLLFPLVLFEGPISTIAAGLLAAAGLVVWPVAYAVVVIADLAGDTLYYLLGRSARRPRARRLLDRIGLTHEKLAAMEASFGRNGGKALVAAKVADFAAVPTFVAAGLTKVGYGRFLAWTAAATVPKAGLLMILGYLAGGQALAVAGRLAPGPILSLALLAIVPIAYLLVAKAVLSRGPENEIQDQVQMPSQGGQR
jgi:membrane protein DedA with SNARE-associated domain